ncbi:MAG: hypothetical protein K2J39_10780 [Ruminococcus sp.]|nr:hypothetical protein [Ruminococcus sp.]
MNLNHNKIRELSAKITDFEKSGRVDYTNCKSFFERFLNTADPAERQKLADEFKKRHMELYNFIRENPDLMSAESDIYKFADGIFPENSDNPEKTNFFDMIREKLNDL